MKRMTIERYVPPAPPEPNDGLPPMLPLPEREGRMQIKFLGRSSFIDAWSSEGLVKFAKKYARACCAALDVEIDVLKTERDALKQRLDELLGADS